MRGRGGSESIVRLLRHPGGVAIITGRLPAPPKVRNCAKSYSSVRVVVLSMCTRTEMMPGKGGRISTHQRRRSDPKGERVEYPAGGVLPP